ncbi:hypothetical protein [Granulicella arctica]|uniref:hypothetical protein n=1 Tax=Granulicella arctica TaxID=940613 RepID=UPI0021DFBDF0|nr:hypothetical protein [Granulicella arctica]
MFFAAGSATFANFTMDGANEFLSGTGINNGWFSVLRWNPFRKKSFAHVQLYSHLAYLVLTLLRWLFGCVCQWEIFLQIGLFHHLPLLSGEGLLLL